MSWDDIALGLGIGTGPASSPAPIPSSWRIVARDRNRARVGEISGYTTFDAEPFLNQGAAWRMTLPALLTIAPHLTIGAGIIVYRDGDVFLSGTILERDDEEGPDGDTIELRGWDDTAMLAFRTVWPRPAGPPFDVAADSHTGPASAAMAHFFDLNAGPGTVSVGRPERQMTGLSTAIDPSHGLVDSYTGNFETLLELLQSIAVRGGGLRFQLKQLGAEIVPVIDTPADRTRSVVFSRKRGNVVRMGRRRQAATANAVIVGGDGTPPSRLFHLDSDPESIAQTGIRAEKFVEQRGAQSVNELIQAGAEALANGAGGVLLDVEVADTESVRFGRDYGLGDRVAVVASDGEAFTGYVSSVAVALGGDEGESIRPTITPTTVAPRAGLGGPTGSLAGRLSYLERNPGSPFRAGMLMMWLSADAPPDGWLFADGTAGTTDMRGRFPLGASATYPLGTVGGSAILDSRHTHPIGGHEHPHAHGGGTLAYAHVHSTPAHEHDHTHIMSHGHSHAHTTVHTHPGSHSHGLSQHVHDYDINHDHPEFETGDAEGTIGTATSDAIHSGAALSAGSFQVALENHTHNADPPNLTGTSKTTDEADKSAGGLFTSTESDSNVFAADPATTGTHPTTMTGSTGPVDPDVAAGAGTTGAVDTATDAWSGTTTEEPAAAAGGDTGEAGDSGASILNPYRAVHFIQYVAAA